MHSLEVLDTLVFRFVNQSLSNPVFDRLMPWLSGNAAFSPLLAVAAVWLVRRHRHKGALCLMMLALIIPLGDSFVITTLKKAIQRPRPFIAHAETIQLDKASPYASLPSAHAANWFAATMILYLYFRRSWRVALPLAVAVSLSRVYNGVHYPGDVLAGGILGAGYGFIGVYTLQAAWRWLGKKYFPLWHEQLPTLVPDDSANANAPESKTQPPAAETQSHWLRAGYLLIACLTLARWLYLAGGTIELSEDEAYQWHWSKHLALSYYSKPPLIAYTQFLGTSIWGDTTFGVRFFSPLIAALLAVMLLRFLAREVNARTGFFAVLILSAAPLLAVGATLMTVDPLSVLFWTLAMFAGWKAIRSNSGVREWSWVGLWMGLGFLSKYTALFQLLCWVVFFALWKPARIHLRRPGPWMALLITAICSLPVIIWNQQHEWITATHVAGNASLGKQWQPTLKYFLEFVGAEAGLLNPVFFFSMLWAAIAFWRRYQHDARLIYFFSMGAPVFLVYLAWSFHSRVFPNWIAPCVLPLFIVMIIYWEAQHRAGARQVVPSLVAGLAIGLVGVVLLHDTDLIRRATKRALPPEIDPLTRVRAWTPTAKLVGEARNRLLAEGKPVFIIGAHYGITSLVSFYLPEAKAAVTGEPLVYCRRTSVPDDQFFFWPGYGDRKGQNAIFVAQTHRVRPVPEDVIAQFESITELPPQPVTYRGRVIRNLRLFELRNLR